MSLCTASRTPAPGPLIHIRHGFTAVCANFLLAVETDANGWMAQVRSRDDDRAIYSAERWSLSAAKVAATEFALLSSGNNTDPEWAARQLRWREYW